jgi:hypothetical protein
MRFGSGHGAVTNYLIFEIPTDMPFIPKMAVRRKLPWRNGRGRSVYRFYDSATLPMPTSRDCRSRMSYVPGVRAGEIELEELLDAGMQLRYWAWGFDAQTGAIGTASSAWIKCREQVTTMEEALAAPGEIDETATDPSSEAANFG